MIWLRMEGNERQSVRERWRGRWERIGTVGKVAVFLL